MYLLWFIGLIHANHGLAITDYVAKELRNNNNEVSNLNYMADLYIISASYIR